MLYKIYDLIKEITQKAVMQFPKVQDNITAFFKWNNISYL